MAAESKKRYFTPGTGGPICEWLERLATKATPFLTGMPANANDEIARWEHTENLGIPSARASSVELGLMVAHGILLMFTGLVIASLLAVFPGQRPVLAFTTAGVVVAINIGNVLHLARWYQARSIRRKQWQQYDHGVRDLESRTLSSDRDVLLQIAAAIPVTIWFILNVRVHG